jgi:hypothetical protein
MKFDVREHGFQMRRRNLLTSRATISFSRIALLRGVVQETEQWPCRLSSPRVVVFRGRWCAAGFKLQAYHSVTGHQLADIIAFCMLQKLVLTFSYVMV